MQAYVCKLSGLFRVVWLFHAGKRKLETYWMTVYSVPKGNLYLITFQSC